MKRNKHITINLTEEQYQILEKIADDMQRNNSDAAYMLLLEIMNKKIIQICDINNTGFKQLKYK